MPKALKNSLIPFSLVFALYGIISSSYLSYLGFTYGLPSFVYTLYSTFIYAVLGFILGVMAWAILLVYQKLVRFRLNTHYGQLSFNLIAATSIFYFVHLYIRILTGYLHVHALQTKYLLLLGLLYGLVLLLLHRLFSRLKKPKRAFMSTVLSLLLAVSFSLIKYFNLSHSQFSSGGKNIFVISVDTLNTSFLHAYGNEAIETPAIDSLAKDGTLFENAYATAPYTWSSLSSFLTGQFTLKHGVRYNGWSLEKDALTLPELFKKSGYTTVGTSDLDFREMGFDQGFDRLLTEELGIFEIQPFRHLLFFIPYYSYWFGTHANNSSSLSRTLIASRWLRKLTSGSSNFFWIHYYEDSPHLPYTSPEPYFTMYLRKGNKSQYDGGRSYVEKLSRGLVKPTSDDLEKIKALYAGELTWCDYQIGVLLDQLKQMGLYDSATIIFFSDHGEGFGRKRNNYRHGRFLFNELLRIPLIIKLPKDAGVRGGIRVDQSVRINDIFPTIAELFGLKFVEDNIDGISLVPFLRERLAPDYKFWLYAETLKYDELMSPIKDTYRVGFTVMNDQWKAISVPDMDEYHLYKNKDLSEDENVNDQAVIKALNEEAMRYFNLKSVGDLLHIRDVEISEDTTEKLKALGYFQ